MVVFPAPRNPHKTVTAVLLAAVCPPRMSIVLPLASPPARHTAACAAREVDLLDPTRSSGQIQVAYY
jgi:hypothetical protein